MAKDAAAAVLNLGAGWTPDALSALLGQAMELAVLEGREAAFQAGDGPGFADIDFTRQEFREQIDFLTQKRPKPTRVWIDAMHGDHDRAFVVAGVTDMAMLEEFQAAIVEAAQTYDTKGFAAEFDRLVEKYGWSYNGGRSWRIRTIVETNLRTSYMAGRLRQMRDPDMVKLRPYWQYRHADTRVPENPRPEHLGFEGLVLDWDDPWWDEYFPPNGWACSCGMHSLSAGDLRRLGKTGPDKAPPITRKPYTDRLSGQIVQLPEGVDFGWDYMPGDHWQRGLTPGQMLMDPDAIPRAGRHVVHIDKTEPIDDLLARAVPFKARPLDSGLPDEDYVKAIVDAFKGHPQFEAPFFTDKAGHRMLISDDLFRDRQGLLKVHVGDRGVLTPLLAEAIMDPDGIWLGIRANPLPGDFEDMVMTRRYIRTDAETGLFAAFDLGRRFWTGTTGFRENPAKGIRKMKIPKEKQRPHIVPTEAVVAEFRAGASERARLIFEIGVGTVQRPGDWVGFFWGDYDGESLMLRQNKTGVFLMLPCTPQLKAALDGAKAALGAAPHPARRILTTLKDDALTYHGVVQIMSKERARLGMEKAFDQHGLRYRGVMELAWADCDDDQIASYSGHTSKAMIIKYAGEAHQIMRARQAAEKRG